MRIVDAFENCRIFSRKIIDLIDYREFILFIVVFVRFFLLLKIPPFAGLLFISVIIHRISVARHDPNPLLRFVIESNTKFHET